MFDSHLSRRALPIGARLTAVLAATVVFAPPRISEARKARENPICVNAYKQGRLLERAARLHQAKDSMLKCTKLICSAALRKECMAAVEKLERDAPTVVLEVTDDRGSPVTNVRVSMDGRPLVSRIDGRALPVDPGFHEFTFENAGVVFAKEKVVVLQGQRNRAVSASLVWQRKASDPPPVTKSAAPVRGQRRLAAQAPPPPVEEPPPPVEEEPPPPPPPVLAKAPVSSRRPPAAEPPPEAEAPPPEPEDEPLPPPTGRRAAASRAARAAAAEPPEADEPDEPPAPEPTVATRASAGREFSATPYVLGGTAVLGLGSAALLTYWGRKDNKELTDTCAPNCSQKSVNHVKRLYLVSNIAAGVGVVALGAWAYHMMFASPAPARREPPPEAALPRPARGVSYSFGVQPLPSGGFAGVTGSF
jgi:hypothetical protein